MGDRPGDIFAGLQAQATRLAARDVSSVELVELALARAADLQPSIQAFRLLRDDAAREAAARADALLDAGVRRPLLGVPVAIKDDCDLAGETTPFGCAGRFQIKTEDSEVVRRLTAAGAVVIGKTHTPELGLYPWTEGPAFGSTRNPWDLDRTPGGSSGGSAAAVAAGVVAAALGSDGAGSVRIPASWCNLVGIKPQRGRISTWPDAEAFRGITCIGPLARTVVDAALLLDVVSGNHPGDRHHPPAPWRPYVESARREPPRLRIALSLRAPWLVERVSPAPSVAAAVLDVADRLSRLGHHVEEADPPYDRLSVPFAVRAAVGVREWSARVPDVTQLDPRTVRTARAGRWLRGPLVALAEAAEGPLGGAVSRMFDRHDVILSPVTAVPPLPIGAAVGLSNFETERLMARSCPYTWPSNYLGWPAVSIPAGFTGGLPIGAQLAGPANSEGVLISLAAELESDQPWSDRHPDV